MGNANRDYRNGVRSFTSLRTQHVVDEVAYQRVLHQGQLVLAMVLAIGGTWLLAGVGVLFRTRWACLLVLVSAGVSILWELGWAVPIVGHDVPFLGYLLTHASIKGFRYEVLRDLYIWLKVALTIGWYGLFLWYFTRPSVKAQFQKQT